MDPFDQKPILPVDLVITIAINIVVAVLGYYLITAWRLGALLADPSLAWMRTRAIAADLLGRRSSIQSAIAIVQLLDS